MEEKTERRGEDEEQMKKKKKPVLGVLSRSQFTMLCVGVGVFLLLLIITVTSVVLTIKSESGSSETLTSFPTDGDMLEFLLQHGEIAEKDGLYATWYHSANSKAEMNQALQSEVMILEADVNIEGHNTINQTNTPIMAHPPDIYSDNTLEQWLDSVLKSKKGIKLDFKSLEAVEPSLDLLRIKNQTGINRPVWINADILHGPNVPQFWPVVNATRFLSLIQEKFPDVTISPGWKVLYVSMFPTVTYTRVMVEEMYDAVKHLPQKITFPVLAVMAKNGWPHLSWLLSRSSRFSLTLWQDQNNPTVEDLLFIRDNSNPQRIYYDVYEPVLTQFKEASKVRNRARRFYSGGDIVDYFRPENNDGLNILWKTVTDRDALLSILKDRPGGMLVIPVISGSDEPNIPVVKDSQPEFPLQECLELILASTKSWGVYLRVKSVNQLENSLHLLQQAYDRKLLHHPVWINMDVAYGAFSIPGYIPGHEFLRTINEIFPFVTIAPSWPREVLDQGYTRLLVEDMMELLQDTWQDVSLQLQADYLESSKGGLTSLLQSQPHFSLTVELKTGQEGLKRLTSIHKLNKQRTFYNMVED